MTTGANVHGFGNGFLDNYLSVVDANTLAADWLLTPDGRASQRITFPVGDSWYTGSGAPNIPVSIPPQYEPDVVYQPVDTQPGLSQVWFRTRADSRTDVQTGGVYNRNYIASRPLSGYHYVMGCLMGPDVFDDPGIPQSQQNQWPSRPVVVTEVAY
jgi:hypothetical protein